MTQKEEIYYTIQKFIGRPGDDRHDEALKLKGDGGMNRKILEKLLDEMPVKDFQSALWLAQNIDLVVDYLIDNGGIFPPCKIGTILYNIVDEVEEIPVVDKVEEIHVFGFDIDKDDHYLMVERWGENINEIMFNNDYWLINFNEFGKTVFPTREAAEQALKEREQ